MRVEKASWLFVAFVASGCLTQEEQAVSPSSQGAMGALEIETAKARRSGYLVRSAYPGRPGMEDGEPAPKKPPAHVTENPETGNTSNAAQIVGAMRPDFRACYQRALDEDPNVAGSVRVSIRIGAEGAVDSATGYSTNLPRDLVDCIVSRAAQSRFDPPEGGAAVVNVPVNLVKQ